MIANLLDRDEWLRQRRAGIGSADAAPLLQLSRWRTPLHVYLDKMGELGDDATDRMRWGIKLEDVVAQAYQEEYGNPVRPPESQIAVHPQHSILLASIDRMTVVDGTDRILEIKTAENADGWGLEGSDDIPDYYLCQVQHQMMVAGIPIADVAVLIGGNRLRRYTVQYSKHFCDHLLRVELDFWKHVETKTPPPIDWTHPSTVELVKKMYGVDEIKSIALDDEAHRLAREYLLCRRDVASAEAKKDRVKSELLLLMQDAATARLPDGSVLKRKNVTRPPYYAKGTSYLSFNISQSEAMKNDVGKE